MSSLGREWLPKQLWESLGPVGIQRPPNNPTIDWAANLDPDQHSFSKWAMQDLVSLAAVLCLKDTKNGCEGDYARLGLRSPSSNIS